MKKWILAALLCSMAGAAAAQVAQPGIASEPAQKIDEIRVSTPRIAPGNYVSNMWRDEFDEVKGQYRLSNGQSMQLTRKGRRMYAQIDGMAPTQLVAVSPYEFIAMDESLKMRIDGAGTHYNDAVIEIAVDRVASTLPPVYVRLQAGR